MLFMAVAIFIGIKFYLFVSYLEQGAAHDVNTLSSFDGIDPKKMQRMILAMKQFKEQQILIKKLQKQKGE